MKTLDNLSYLKSLTLNKKEEKEKQKYYNEMLQGELLIKHKNDDEATKGHSGMVGNKGKVITEYLRNKIEQVRQQMEEDIFKHFVIQGEEGSGKMSFVELLSHSFHSETDRQNIKAQNPYIVVTLEETFDSKNLVGTYVCNESGEFVFKKGPLTVAAE